MGDYSHPCDSQLPHGVAVVNRTTGEVRVLLGDGARRFTAAGSFAASAVAAADMNRDGRIDLVTTSETTGQAAVLLGNGNGTFQAASQFASGATGAASIATGDCDEDGRVDAVLAKSTRGTATALFNR